ncbi:DNA-binding protein [Psychrobacter sp. 4Dc]|uniref:methylation-associated defense system helix-turn-helix domain-containing protein MAD1 n=1 Tax=Psychrobacter sp. 4Dc TaxID=888437 RepID=UPI000CB2973B|nr:helix-turn-helix domain-containing protein [Psychrobacter sp. 4Dc]PKH64198.1 DNA-binding protein [Psychrobacter sp. 4Dc]
MDNEVLTIKEVAEYLKVNERTIYRLAASNELPGFRVGNAWRFKRSDLDDWMLKQTEQPAIKE